MIKIRGVREGQVSTFTRENEDIGSKKLNLVVKKDFSF